MSKIETGGPAFPRPAADFGSYGHVEQDGMTLRDYFAAKAMAGALAGEPGSHLQPANLAVESYAHADAMIAARGGDHE